MTKGIKSHKSHHFLFVCQHETEITKRSQNQSILSDFLRHRTKFYHANHRTHHWNNSQLAMQIKLIPIRGFGLAIISPHVRAPLTSTVYSIPSFFSGTAACAIYNQTHSFVYFRTVFIACSKSASVYRNQHWPPCARSSAIDLTPLCKSYRYDRPLAACRLSFGHLQSVERCFGNGLRSVQRWLSIQVHSESDHSFVDCYFVLLQQHWGPRSNCRNRKPSRGD